MDTTSATGTSTTENGTHARAWREGSKPEVGSWREKAGLAQMLKGGVIMDVVTPEQAKIAEDAGAVSVMALERVPSDIRRDGGVARMSDPDLIDGIIDASTISSLEESYARLRQNLVHGAPVIDEPASTGGLAPRAGEERLPTEGDLQIDGTVEGDVISRAVTIGEGAVVHGTLTADSARIYGALVGHIKVGNVMLAKTAKVEADIHHVSLAVESGASIVGSLRRLDSATKAEPGETAAPESIAVGDVRREA